MVESGAEYGFFFERKPNNDIILKPEGEHKYTIIWMHGLGDSSNGFLDFFFTEDSSPSCIIPHKVYPNMIIFL
jgi:predicted esterase